MEIIDDLTYTTNHSSDDGTLFFIEVLTPYPPLSTETPSKPISANVYTPSSKDSVMRSATRNAWNISSIQHLKSCLDTVYATCLQNSYPFQRVNSIMNNFKKLENPKRMIARHHNATAPSRMTFHSSLTKNHKEDSLLWRHQSKTPVEPISVYSWRKRR